MKPCDYQHIIFNSLKDNCINTGSNLISNGDYTNTYVDWNGNYFQFTGGTANFNSGATSQVGKLYQTIPLTIDTAYKIRFKYRAIDDFKISVYGKNLSTSNNALSLNEYNTISDGFWHTIELIVVATESGSYNEITLEFTPLNGQKTGIIVDDVSVYKQTKDTRCKPCDVLLKDKNTDIEFQLSDIKPTGNNLLLGQGNTFSPITSNNLVFDLNFDVNGEIQFYKSFQLYIENNVYIFALTDTVAGPTTPYTTESTGNTTLILINTGLTGGAHISPASLAGRLHGVLTAIIDVNHGTTSTISGSYPFTLTISNVPVGSYLLNNKSVLTNISTIGVDAGLTTNNMYYESDKLCYLHFGIDIDIFSLSKQVSLTSGGRYLFELNYSNDFSNWGSCIITVNDGVNPILQIPITPVITSNGVYQFEYTPTVTGNITFKLDVQDTNHINKYGFCVSKFSLRKYENSISVKYIDCNGNTGNLDIISTSVLGQIFVQIPSSNLPENQFQIEISDGLGNNYTSIPIRLIDTSKGCTPYLVLKWSDTCKFGCIDYATFPFTNELILEAYLSKQSLSKRERETADYHIFYNHSASKYELRIGAYSSELHTTLERALEHSIININGDYYYVDEDSNYTVSELNMGLYTGRITLTKSGTEVIKSSCCC